jgi:excisionase family DNA binding protein
MPGAKKRRKTTTPKPVPTVPSPWLTAKHAATYLHRGRRFVLREIHAGRLRAAVVGGRQEVLTRPEWCDQWVNDQAGPPVPIPMRRRGTAT